MKSMTAGPIPSLEMVRRLDVAAPRYTSYPTIPIWQPASNDDPAREALAEATAEKPFSLYLHIPFCPVICHYCGCNTELKRDDAEVDRYVGTLVDEIRLARKALKGERRVTQIHWGGGSPTVLDQAQFARIFSAIHAAFRVSPDAEVAIEVNPMTCRDEKLAFLLESGFNRISLGIQDFDAGVQKMIGRNQTFARTREFVELIRNNGVDSLNFDLVYGLPGQGPETMRETLERLVQLRPDRVAVYSFAWLPNLRENQRKIDAGTLPPAEKKFGLYLQTIAALQDAGYLSIGMDHFALPEDELAHAISGQRLRRNFMGYTTKAETNVLAFGATGISDIDAYYAQNERGLSAHREAVAAGRLPVMRECRLDTDDRIRRRAIMSILCNGSLRFAELAREFAIDPSDYFAPEIERLAQLEEEGLVLRQRHEIAVTPLGHYFLRNIALVFDNYLDRRKGVGAAATYSRTV